MYDIVTSTSDINRDMKGRFCGKENYLKLVTYNMVFYPLLINRKMLNNKLIPFKFSLEIS